MEKRFQVFISSTYMDLIEERREVMQALLELDCLPSGMELFPAANKDQWSYIQKVIDDSDYYVLILGGRYGSKKDDGISYTEMEYDYAISKNKPVIAFLHKNIEDIPAKFSELDPANRLKLESFRNKAQTKLCKMWENPSDLGGTVSRSIIQLIKSHPADGWVKGIYASDPESINKLHQKIIKLESELNSLKTEAPLGAEELQQGQDYFSFEVNYYQGGNRAKIVKANWDNIISELGPFMYDEAAESTLRTALVNLAIREFKLEGGSHRIDQKDFYTVLIQIKALGIINKSDKKRTASDRSTYWSLTPYGESKISQLKALRKDEI